MSNTFTHLHVHTQFSLLDGAARITDLINRAKALGQNALAITDHGVMYGTVDFYRACKDAGIKPILGMEAYVAPQGMAQKTGSADRENAHLILLAKNEIGWRNLMFLSSEAFIHGFYYKPRIDYALLEKHAEGLICLSACLAGDIPQNLLHGRDEQALAVATNLKKIFGADFYIELQNHGIPEQLEVLPKLAALARELQIKTVATNDIHYVNRDDAEAQDVLLCIQTLTTVDEPNRMRMQSDNFYLKSYEEMREALPDYPEALANTQEIADKCNLDIAFGIRRLPEYTVPNGQDKAAYLQSLCVQGLARKMPWAGEEERQRLEFELSVISRMRFVDYFLIVWDFIRFAKSKDIMVGPGRGSGAGSLAAYALDITDVDPIANNLLFERFLNPERISMPDFDIDFCYERRQEVIDYVAEKYGDGQVAQIITFGTMAARAVIRDVGRALRMPYADADKLAKAVPSMLKITLSEALRISPELRKLYEEDENSKKVIDLSMKLEGLPRHSSTHAAGVVIAGQPLVHVVPLQSTEGQLTTQYPMTTLEELGLLKMDFLGLRTLTVIRDSIAFIRAGGQEAPDFSKNDFTDPEVYHMIARGETEGVFQLESAGMTQFMTQLMPDCFEDLTAGISLYRPGPMDSIPKYVRCKHHPEEVRFAHPLLQPILKSTYGCIVYQEQVMQIVRDLAGYSYGRSDLVRRAMSKKKHDVMQKERAAFVHGTEGVDGAFVRGVPVPVAEKIFDEMMDFASYAFNKSHAACYAVLAYRTAYLRRYYPTAFFAAMINSYMGSLESMANYVSTARRLGIPVLPPDVNKSAPRFSVEGNAIRFGLSAVKNVGSAVMRQLVEERERNGAFKSFTDFAERTDGLNKRMMENMIYAGCFDAFGETRCTLFANFERVMEAAANRKKAAAAGQMSLFDFGEAALPSQAAQFQWDRLAEYPQKQLLQYEREATGLYLSGHPLDAYTTAIHSLSNQVLELSEADGESGTRDNAVVLVGGMLTQCKQRPTKTGSGIIGYAMLEGITGSVEVVLFPRTLENCNRYFHEDAVVSVRGRLNVREDRANSILVDELNPLTIDSKSLYIKISADDLVAMGHLRNILMRFPGAAPVILVDPKTRKAKKAPEAWNITWSVGLLNLLTQEFGTENVVYK